MEHTEEYKGENFDTIEGAWDWHSQAVPEDVYSLEELQYLLGEEIMFKRSFKLAVDQYANKQKQQFISVIEDRIAELENASYEKHKSRTKYLREIKELKLILNLYKS